MPEEEKEGLKLLGIKITERLRFEKPTVYVEVIQRYEYVRAGHPEEGVKSAPAPLAIVEGCKYDFSVIAAMVSMKMGFHIPTYRQQDWFAQSGWFPSRSTGVVMTAFQLDQCLDNERFARDCAAEGLCCPGPVPHGSPAAVPPECRRSGTLAGVDGGAESAGHVRPCPPTRPHGSDPRTASGDYRDQ